jgi:putative acetyltransferase
MSLAPCAKAISETPRGSNGRASEDEAVVTVARSPHEVDAASNRTARGMAEISVRPARADESDGLAALFRLSREAALPYLPDLHTPEQDRAFFRERVFVTCEVWVAESDGTTAGFCAVRDGWIDHLYVHPAHQRRGFGAVLVRKAMEKNDRLKLWTFQRNVNARAFYEAQGFHCVRLTDGRDNEEREPDALYEWVR